MTARRTGLLAAVAAGLTLGLALPASAAQIIVVTADPPGQGLNDETPATPTGLNPGTTLGQQRQVAFFYAAQLWGKVLESDATVFVGASFQALTCTATSAVLGSAGTTFVFRDFPNAPKAGTWYSSALADALAGVDQNPGFIDINSLFNSRIGTDPTCLGGRSWYYGLDHNPPPGDIDFLNVVMHEIGHGLGVQGFSNLTTGAFLAGFPGVYEHFTFDNTLLKNWAEMSNEERVFSGVNDGKVVWNGGQVFAGTALVLGPRPVVIINSPPAIAGTIDVQTASFGPGLTLEGLTGDVVLADDGTGNTEGCGPITSPVAGNIALIDRGTCNFTVKVANAQAAGAIAAIIANNAASGLPGMGGADPTIVIPSVGISLNDGNAIKAKLPGVNVTLARDENLLAGADDFGQVRLFMPNPVQGGSSRSHFDSVAEPDLLMEPAISSSLRAATNLDLTPALLEDEGWTTNGGTASIAGCDTGLAFYQEGGAIIGATIEAHAAICSAFGMNLGGFASCMAQATESLVERGVISGKEKGRVQRCMKSAN